MGFIRVLVVDDYEPFRRLIRSLVEGPTVRIIGEAFDGPEAVHKATLLQPELILLDIGLPKLNGIEVARHVGKLTHRPKILFVSQESDADVIGEALSVGSSAYLSKTDVGQELLPAVEALLSKEQSVEDVPTDRQTSREEQAWHPRLSFEFDNENKIARCKLRGPFTSSSIRDYYRSAALFLLGRDFRGSIADFTEATSCSATAGVILELSALPPLDPVRSRPRVVVAPNAQIFEFVQLFYAAGKSTRSSFHVVRDFTEASALLGVPALDFRPVWQLSP